MAKINFEGAFAFKTRGQYKYRKMIMFRDVTTGATGATEVAPKF